MASNHDKWLQEVREAPGPLTVRQLRKHLGVDDDHREGFARWLEQAVEKGLVVRNRRGRYAASERFNLMPSTLHVHPRGFAFAGVAGHDQDLFIAPGDKGGAMHGDRVLVRLRKGPRRGDRAEGEVVRVLSRANQRVVGELSRRRRYGLVTADDSRITEPIVVDSRDQHGAGDGEKVVVEVTQWPQDRQLPEGRVVERLGMPESPGVQERALLARYDLDPGFPPEVMAEAESLEPVTSPGGRVDLRDRCVITIDPAGARDHDDALSLEEKQDGWRLGVHIADVSHYVTEGTAIDDEARSRGTSVYLVEQVVPMLPPALSEDLCSLREGVDRPCMTVFLDYSDEGVLEGVEVVRSLIRVACGMSYEDAQAVIDSGGDDDRESRLVIGLHRLSEILETSRHERGSIDFDLPEEDISLDRLGRPVGIDPRPRTPAHRLVENCMLAANEAVAARYHELGVPFMYRVHPEPGEDRVEDAADFLAKLGLKLEITRPLHPRPFQKLLEQVEGRPDERLVNMVLLRSLAIAHYSHQCRGHFALALDRYCHFTSPIRRYPDLVVHRVMGALLSGKPGRAQMNRWESSFPQVADQCSGAERRADEIERDARDIKKAQYMRDRVGEIFDGVISGVTVFGVFVQLPNAVEGLVHVSTMNDDYYVFQEEDFSLNGRRTGRRLRLGDPVRIQVTRASVADRKVDFRLVDDDP